MMQTSYSRDTQLDNIKGVMIFLVVFCHCVWKFFPDSFKNGIPMYLCYAIYSFHMPIFIFLSGFFCQHSAKSGKSRFAFSRYLIPYLFINTAYQIVYHFSAGNTIDFLQPVWTLWYLLSLFMWSSFSQCIPANKATFVFSILLSLVSGALSNIGEYASISRTIAFFPYFIAGYYVGSKDLINKIRSLNLLAVIGCFTVIQIAVFFMARASIAELTFELRASYSLMGQSVSQGACIRLFAYVAGFISILFAVRTVPSQKTMISVIGSHSFTIFIGHAAIILALAKVHLTTTTPFVVIIISALVATVICFLLGNKIAYAVYKKVSSAIDHFFC